MKHFFTLIAYRCFYPLLTLFYGIDEIVAALKTGNASQIAKYFDNTVEIALPDKTNSYSKSQGEMVLKIFLQILL
jgi:hypothetical protein